MLTTTAFVLLLLGLQQGPADGCFTRPVGVFDQAKIPDNQMTASSQYCNAHQAAYGRLNEDRGGGWCAKEAASDDDWLQVDLGTTFQVCGMATQGDRTGNEWVTAFKLSYSSDGITWTTYKDEDDEEVVFNRQGDSNRVDQHLLPAEINARFIRIHPTAQHDWNCISVEYYGCKVEPTEPPTEPPVEPTEPPTELPTQPPEEPTEPPTEPPTQPPVCEDKKPAKKCKRLKKKGGCDTPEGKSQCQKTCGICGGGVCEDKKSAMKCKRLKKKGGCDKPKVKRQCQKTCGICGGEDQ